jgi:hypothetical protein
MARNVCAHEGHQAATYKVTPAAANVELAKYLRLKIVNANSGVAGKHQRRSRTSFPICTHVLNLRKSVYHAAKQQQTLSFEIP